MSSPDGCQLALKLDHLLNCKEIIFLFVERLMALPCSHANRAVFAGNLRSEEPDERGPAFDSMILIFAGPLFWRVLMTRSKSKERQISA